MVSMCFGFFIFALGVLVWVLFAAAIFLTIYGIVLLFSGDIFTGLILTIAAGIGTIMFGMALFS